MNNQALVLLFKDESARLIVAANLIGVHQTDLAFGSTQNISQVQIICALIQDIKQVIL